MAACTRAQHKCAAFNLPDSIFCGDSSRQHRVNASTEYRVRIKAANVKALRRHTFAMFFFYGSTTSYLSVPYEILNFQLVWLAFSRIMYVADEWVIEWKDSQNTQQMHILRKQPKSLHTIPNVMQQSSSGSAYLLHDGIQYILKCWIFHV